MAPACRAMPARRSRSAPPAKARSVNQAAPAFGKRKAVLYATCFVNFNNTDIGAAARAVLAKNGVETEVVYPACCGMPKLELGDHRGGRRRRARRDGGAAALGRQGLRRHRAHAVLRPHAQVRMAAHPAQGPAVERLSQATFDISEYVVDIAKKEGLAPGLEPIEGGVSVHLACHARAQNMGAKAAEMLRLVPKTRVAVIERCSGHGGIWGARTENFETAVKVGKPAAQAALKNDTRLRRVGMPACGRASDAGHGNDRRRAEAQAVPRTPSDRAAGARLRTDGARTMTPRKIETSAILPLSRVRQAARRAPPPDRRDQEEPAAGGRPVRDVLLRIATRRCCTRCTRCCSSRRAARRRFPTSLRPTIR